MTDPTLKLLLVDDEDSVREPLSRFLQADPYHYEISDVPNFEEAVKLLEEKRGHFDVALIDEVLGDGPSGLEILKYIKSAYSDIEVILFTGWGLKSGEKVRQIGAYSYIAKPFDADQLALTIYNAAERRRIRREHKYMEALVRASQELAQTTQRNKQLNLAWEFVSGQLDVSSFFIALYDYADDRIYFPLAFDKGRQVNLPDVILGDDFTTWGLAGYVVKKGEEVLWSTLEEKEQVCTGRKLFPRVEGEPSASCFCVPLIIREQICGVLSAQSYQHRVFTLPLQNALRAVAGHLSIALENSRLFAEINQKAKDNEYQSQRIAALEKLAISINSNLELGEILTKTCQAAADFFHADHSGLVLFDKGYAQGVVEAEYPDFGARGQIIPLHGIPLEEQLIKYRTPLVIDDVRKDKRLGAVQDIMLDLGIQSSLLVPVVGKIELLGSFSLDFTQNKSQFTEDDIELCQIFASQVAVAIENGRLYHEAQNSRDYLHSLFKASSEVISPRDPNDVLQSIVAQAHQSTGAWRAVILLVDEGGYPQILASSGFEHHLEAATSIRESGISRNVMASGKPRFIEDVGAEAQAVHPKMWAQGVRAAACMPLPRWEKTIGVLWIHYLEKRTFSDAEKQALQIYANQSAIAYDNARHIRELEQLREATEAMASVAEPKQVLQKIVEGAMQVLGADIALIWSYDANRDFFIPEELVAEGISEERLEEFRREEPKAGAGRTTRHVLENGYLKVTDVINCKDIGKPTRTFLNRLDVKSFQSIRLDVAGEPLGVLHVDYKTIRDFGKEERRILEHFANHAALTLKKARLLAQIRRASDAARVITEVTTLGKLNDTLKVIVRGARDVLGCDIVTLYTFNEKTQKFVRAEGIGYNKRSHLRPPHEVIRNSSLWRVVELSEPYYYPSDNAQEDGLLQGGFVSKEKVRSSLGIQLRFEGERVGVMFVNFRTPHRFKEDEINDALQFGNQAAVAIRNVQLHEKTERQAKTLGGLYEAGKAITSTLAVDEALTRIAEQALHIIGADPEDGCFSHVALHEGGKLRFIASWPTDILDDLRRNVGEIDLQKNDRKGIAGYAVLTGQSKKVDNVHGNRNYIPLSVDIKIYSQLSVPLTIGKQIIGVLSVEHSKPSAFSEEDVQNVESLATQAAVAIRNANLFRATETVTSSLNLDDIFATACQKAVDLFKVDHSGLVLFDEDLKTGKVVAEHPDMGIKGLDIPLVGVPAEEELIASKKPLVITDVQVDPGFQPVWDILAKLGTRSILIIPIISKGRIIGSFGLDTMRTQRIFTKDEIELCKIFASQVAVAIENARRHGRVEKMLAARTALAWTGMMSSTWRHAIEKHAITIREQVELLHSDLTITPNKDQIEKRLEMMQRLANQILKKPLTPPLSAEEEVSSVHINGFLKERVQQLWAHQPYKDTNLELRFELENSATVRASIEWLRRAVDIIIDNAVDATAGLSERKIIICSRKAGGQAEISIRDNGKGITSEIRDHLFREPIPKTKDAKGLGMGLLFAQMIVQTYGGEIKVEETGVEGTTMAISLPLED